MKIALIGYGKMGRAIEEIALQRGHILGLKIDVDSLESFTKENIFSCDAAIEFTGPHSAADNIIKCLEAGIPVISGSTGWLNAWDQVINCCETYQGSFIYASNFSVGVNVFFELNKKLAQLMVKLPEYEVSIEETHHTAKKDAPSGTAITLAEQVMKENTHKKQWVNHLSGNEADLIITSKRIDPAPGTHSVKFHSVIDDIEIIHTAHSRQGFALGAVLAVEFIAGKKGVYTMQDVLHF